VSIGDLKDNLSSYLAHVRRGEEILVRDRNVPIAMIVPLAAAADVDAELAALAAEGRVRLPRGPLPSSFWRTKAPRAPQARILEVLRAERDER
jgi:prevent-host-death family protein